MRLPVELTLEFLRFAIRRGSGGRPPSLPPTSHPPPLRGGQARDEPLHTRAAIALVPGPGAAAHATCVQPCRGAGGRGAGAASLPVVCQGERAPALFPRAHPLRHKIPPSKRKRHHRRGAFPRCPVWRPHPRPGSGTDMNLLRGFWSEAIASGRRRALARARSDRGGTSADNKGVRADVPLFAPSRARWLTASW